MATGKPVRREARNLAFLLTAALGCAATSAAMAEGAEPALLGWIELVSLPEQGLRFSAKLDTGADTSSINGRNIEVTRRGSQYRVGFDLTDDDGKRIRIERPLAREARIKRAGSETSRRLVVRLDVCLAGRWLEGEFTIADRGRLEHQVLIGRNLMAGRIIVDPARRELGAPHCTPRH